ncbi:mannose-6-phosphate isomerase, class I [Staphylococcus borealis]|uniref:mannose-6-phosphate isomerase, class I n=1 Tax=Staphylococcus borealis TaxID=2742203 RepID=UPI000FEF0014|nr:mannose-6-phosphate isomerase, class I [Staphylococcus borealis]MDM7862486.1 mannose-6-phosphate isomerase, class I [Staphylococcus borealis]MDM7881297.1 mannose-6-phosphate isomerase, class I [Staphylococcus borealis]RIO91897.1 mannose-6-phosphate isomerase, class I [Staphylococcus haemolyticus]
MVLFLKPVFQERIWGGTALRDEFNYQIPNDLTGECWGISAHSNGPNEIENGKYKGITLDQVWEKNKALFGNDPRDKFPLLTKILDANDKLSVQVHPNDEYALEHENEYGKTECWYIIDANKDAEIIYGVNTQSKQELNEFIDNKEFDKLFKTVQVKPGDFYYVPAGTVHAIGSGIMILETQQSSDTTYRIYDYDRKDKDGNTRDLHLEQSKDVIDVSNQNPNTNPIVECRSGQKFTQFVSNEFFTVEKWDIQGVLEYEKPHDYCLLTIIEGNGKINIDGEDFEIEKGKHFILTTEDNEINFKGELSIIVSYSSTK